MLQSIDELVSEKITGEWGIDPTTDRQVYVLRTTNFTNEGRLNLSNVVTRDIEDKKIQKKKLIVGDIIIEKSGGSPKQPVGRVVYFDKSDGIYLCNNFTSILRASDKVSPKYLFYSLFYKHLTQRTLGYQNKTTGIINLQLDRYLKNESVSVPNKQDQQRIIKILDEADSLRQKRKSSIKLLDKYTESVFIKMFGNPVSNSMGWPTEKFEELGTLDRGKSKHRPRNAPELLGGEHPLIQTGDVAKADMYIKSFTSTYSDIGLKQSKKWPKGTLCITIAANIAKTGILAFDACFPDSVVGFKADTSKTNSVFIHCWMSFFQKILEASAPESAQKNINLRILRNLPVITPPIKLQNTFEILVEEIETIKNDMLSQQTQIDGQFQAQMQKAFNSPLSTK
jgi:type I restriction enzyme S subunit